MKKPKSVKQILNSKSSGLQELLHHSRQLNTLNKHLSRLLPPSLSLHCTAAGLEHQTLTLMTDSPAWATRLRLQAPDIIKALPDFQIKSVTVKIRPLQEAPAAPQRARPAMSAETSKLLNYLAETTNDPRLKLALQRLARRSLK